MLNYLWGGMILIGILTAAFNGNMGNITNEAINSSKEAVTICITIMGVMSLWTGMMEIAERSGLMKNITLRLRPFLKYLFPELPEKSKAFDYIASNVIANFMGLGWAATPAGLKAMDEMQKLNPKKDTATRSMCMFMIFNMSSLQLVSVNIIAYRSQYNSVNPSEIIGAGIFATLVSTVAGILFAKAAEKFDRR